jgi:hypothetical protein
MLHIVLNLLISLFSFQGRKQNFLATFPSKLVYALLCAGLLAQGIAPVHAAESKGLSADQLLNPVQGPILSPLMTSNSWNSLGNGLNGSVYAIAISGTDIYVGGTFTDAGGDPNADRIAKWDGSSWSALGSGLNGQVHTIAVNGSAIYVGGAFTDAGGNASADYISQWDGSNWSTLGNGLNATVYSIAVNGMNVYAGGAFTDAGGYPDADYIVKLDGGTWESLGASPLSGPVLTVAVAGATVYAGGDFFDATGNPNVDYIAMWDGSSWSPLGNGLSSPVYAIALGADGVYAGGNFHNAGGNAVADFVARWDGVSWSVLGSGLNGAVRALAINGTSVYVGGYFNNAGGDANADSIARWDGSSWSALGTGLNSSPNGIVTDGLDIYAGGNFTDAGGNTSGDYIARFEADTSAPAVTSFTALSPSPSVDIPITAFTAFDDAAVAAYLVNESDTPPASDDAGWKTSAPTAYTVGSDGVYTLYPWVKDTSGNVSALYGSPLTVSVDTTPPTIYTNAWNPLGGGLSNTAYDLALSGTDVVAVGSFLNVGGYSNGDRVAKWNGTSWSPMGSGLNGQTNAVAVDGSFIYAGGDFHDAGGDVYANQFARWNGSTWTAWGDGVGGTVNDLAVNGSNLYAAGGFVDAGLGTTADFVAQLSGGTWQPLGATPLTSTALAVALDGSDVYFGGTFANAGGNADADFIAKWNGSSWSALGSGLSSFVRTIAVNNGQIYAGGDFSDAGGNASADRIARWNGSSWSALGSGLNGTVYAIATSGTDIYAGGNFTDAGGDANADYIAKWDGSSWSALGTLPLNGTVYSIAIDEAKIYAGGAFTDAGGNPNADRIAMFVLDTIAPAVASFTVPSISTSLQIPITEFTASDDVAVTGYLITESSTPPSAGAAGWTASAPTSYVVGGDGSYTLYPWVKSAAGNVSPVYGSPANVTVDATKPTVTAFTLPSSSTSLNIPITTFTAADNMTVSGYRISTSSTPPSAGAAGWTGSAPTTYSVGSSGFYVLYPWVKDSLGNVSAVYGSPASILVDATKPTVNSFAASSLSTSLNVSITAFTASDNVAVAGYRITESSTAPSAGSAGWTGSAPTTFTVASQGVHILYPWVKDSLGNVSVVYGSPVSVSVDTTAPTVDSFAATSPSTSLDIPITTFSALDNTAVTAYLITKSATPPAAGDISWEDAAPTIYTVVGDGSYTLYPWVKDAAGNVSAVYGSPAGVTVDANAPTVDSFAATSPATSLDIPITAFTASGDGITGYLITQSSTAPALEDAGWSATAPSTFTVSTDGNYTLYPWIKDAAGNVSALFDSPASVMVDTTAPETSMGTKPSDPTNSSAAYFTFSGDDAAGSGVASFQCQLDGNGYNPCDSGNEVGPVGEGLHTFDVRVLDNAGNMDASPASYSWTVDTTAPAHTLLSRPAVYTTSTSATWTFTATDAAPSAGNLTFLCRLDNSAYGPCVSPRTYSGLSATFHRFYLKAVDGAGNVELERSYGWWVQKERLTNGGLNTYSGISRVPTSWAAATFAATDGKDTTAKKEGTASVKIAGAPARTKALTQTLNLSGVSGDKLTLSFWAKGTSIPIAGACKAEVSLYNGATLVTTKTVNCSTGTYAAFQKKTITFNATSAYTKVVVKFTYAKASGTIWFDGVSLIK